MIDSDATTIGTKHVLGDGVADAIGILESELTTLGRTVTASAPMLQTITRLGAGLNAFNANAAPIATLSDARYLPDPPMEQLNPAMPKQTLIPSVSRSDDHDRSRSTARFDPATPMHSQAQPRGGESSPPAQQVPRRAPVTTAHKGPIATEPTADRPRVAAIAPATSSPAEPPSSGTVSSEPPSVNQSPVVAISIAPGVPEMVQLRRSEVGATPPAKPPGMTMTDKIVVPPDIRMQRIVIGAMAPNDSPHTANDIPAAQGAPPSDIVGTRIPPGRDAAHH